MMRILQWLLSLLRGRDSTPAPVPQSTPASDSWQTCLDWVLEREGGYVDNPRDPGGVTNMGITIETLSRYLGRQATVVDMHVMTRQLAGEIYYHDYWHANRCDEMPPGVNLIMLDCVVMSSPVTVRKWLQAAVLVPQDGVLGPKTMEALAHCRPGLVVQSMTAYRLQHYQSLPTWDTFGRGWTARIDATHDRALQLVALSVPAKLTS